MERNVLERLKHQVVSAMEMTGDLAFKNTLLTMNGSRELRVENYQSLVNLSSEKIVIRGKSSVLTISGKDLRIRDYSKEELSLTGLIQSICIDRR